MNAYPLHTKSETYHDCFGGFVVFAIVKVDCVPGAVHVIVQAVQFVRLLRGAIGTPKTRHGAQIVNRVVFKVVQNIYHTAVSKNSFTSCGDGLRICYDERP